MGMNKEEENGKGIRQEYQLGGKPYPDRQLSKAGEQRCQKHRLDMRGAIRELDQRAGKGGFMFLFLGQSIYFIFALCGDYKEPLYLANLSAAAIMAFLFQSFVRLIQWEEDGWHTMYEKICYFPIGRKEYLLAKAVPAGKILALQIAVQGIAYFFRMLMHQGIAMETMVLVSTCTAASGIWFFLGYLGVLVAGGRAVNLIPMLFVVGIMISDFLAQVVTG